MVPLDLRKFSVDRLRTKSGRRDASAHLSAVLATAGADDTCINQIVTELLSVPNLFPYLCSGESLVSIICSDGLHGNSIVRFSYLAY